MGPVWNEAATINKDNLTKCEQIYCSLEINRAQDETVLLCDWQTELILILYFL